MVWREGTLRNVARVSAWAPLRETVAHHRHRRGQAANEERIVAEIQAVVINLVNVNRPHEV